MKYIRLVIPFLRSPRLFVAAILFTFITLYYAGKVVVVAGSWRLRTSKEAQREAKTIPAQFAPHEWLDALYRWVYVPVLGIRSRMVMPRRDRPQLKGESVVAELNHGMTLEQFLGLRAAMRACRLPIKVVAKVTLSRHPFLSWMFVLPLKLIDAVILVDQNGGDAAAQIIQNGVRHSCHRQVLYLILVDGTRPTARKRKNVPEERRHEGMRRLMPPKARGPHALLHAVDDNCPAWIHLSVGHGLERPYDAFEELDRAIWNRHTAYMEAVHLGVPATHEDYRELLNLRWTHLEEKLRALENEKRP